MRRVPTGPSTHDHAHRSRPRGRAFISAPHRLFVPLLLTLSLLAVTCASVHAQTRPPGGNFTDPAIYAVDVAQPAVVRIVTLYSGHITLSLCGRDVTLPASGKDYQFGQSGSGAFVSANGDILTADHVVTVDPYAFFDDPVAAQDIADLLNTNAGCHLTTPITGTDVANGFVQAANIPFTTHLSTPSRLVWQDTPYTGPDSSASTQQLLDALTPVHHESASIVTESAVDQNDLAIIHVPLVDTPSIPLADSSQVEVEDQLTLIGFPGNGDASHLTDQTVDANDLLTPSVNNLMVSAMKSSSNGARLIQVGGNVEHGDSGGPVLNSAGQIVGVVSFGGSDSPGSTAFLRTSDNARALLSQASVNTTPGPFESQWESAFAAYASAHAGHWQLAAQRMKALSIRYPQFGGILPYLAYAQGAAVSEPVTATTTDVRAVPAAILGIVALALLLALILVTRRRHQRERGALAVAPASPYSTYPTPAGHPMTTMAPHIPPSVDGWSRAFTPEGPAGLRYPYAATPEPHETPRASPPASLSGIHQPVSTSSSSASGAWNAPGANSGMAPSYPSAPPVVAEPMWKPPVTQPGMFGGPPSGLPARENLQIRSDDLSSPATGRCYAGHSMPATEIYCPTCGMPRMPDSPPSWRNAR